MRQWVRDHALGLVFVGLWLLFWAGQTWANIAEYAQDQEAHRQAVTLAGFLAFWGGRTLENVQSEMLQLASFVIFSAYLIYRGSPESKEGQDRLEAKVDAVLRIVALQHDDAGSGGDSKERNQESSRPSIPRNRRREHD